LLVKVKQDLIRNRNVAFINSLANIRINLAIVNAIIIAIALGTKGTMVDYAIVAGYLLLSVANLCVSWIRDLAANKLRVLFLIVDPLITVYMIFRTGGIRSELYPFLFIPVLVSAIRFRYAGTMLCCSILTLILVGSSLINDIFSWRILLIKTGFLYLVGILSSVVIEQTYKVTEDVSDQLAKKNDELQRLNYHLTEVSASSDRGQILTETLRVIQANVDTPMAAMMIFDPRGELKIVYSFGWEDEWLHNYQNYPLSKYSLSLARILAFKKPLICSDIDKHTELIKTFEGTPVQSLFAFPLIIQQEVIGAIMITDVQVKTISEAEIQILTSIANQASIAIQNAISLNEEKKRADTDGLTGLYNRRYFNEKLEDLVYETMQDADSAMSLIMLDVDNFKKYNDTYGHPAGDRLLKKLARVISEVVREEDIVARYGGEEIAVILKKCHNELALEIAERIRSSVQQIRDLECPITVSVGVGTLPDHAKDSKTLLDFTDQSLYHAKHTGKNKVCCGVFS